MYCNGLKQTDQPENMSYSTYVADSSSSVSGLSRHGFSSASRRGPDTKAIKSKGFSNSLLYEVRSSPDKRLKTLLLPASVQSRARETLALFYAHSWGVVLGARGRVIASLGFARTSYAKWGPACYSVQSPLYACRARRTLPTFAY